MSSSLAIYNVPLAFVTTAGASLSVSRLRRALTLLVGKHATLRTCLIGNSHDNTLQQYVLPFDPNVVLLVHVSRAKSAEEVQAILLDEETNRAHFDLPTGRVFRCHVIRRNDQENEDLLLPDDVLVFNFHHVAFDGLSEPIFAADLRQAYATGTLEFNDNQTLTYLDYALWEKNMPLAKHFWEAALQDYEPVALPYDRRPASSTRTGHGSSVKVELGAGELLLAFARQTQVTPFQVCMSVYYIFLYKLTQSQDLVVGSLVANRPRHELAQMIGMFANLVPYRLHVKPQETFRQLIKRVAQMSILVTANAQLPYQHIVQQHYHNTTMKAHTLPYISTGLQFESPTNKIRLAEECELLRYPTSPHVAKYDLWLSIEFDPTEEHKITGSFDYACDVFDPATVVKIARRFECLLTQLFTTSSSISQMSLLLSDEIELLRQLNTGDKLLQPMHLLPIHHQFVLRTQEHPQKVALILDNQSLTYAELLHYTQLVALHLIDECDVKSGDIVGLCVERSIEMAIGILGILISGASYLPFWPGLPIERLHSLIQMTQPRSILIHSATHHLIPSNRVAVDAVISNLNARSTIEGFPCVNASIDNTAVILFTSGSTGMSKAVPLNHRNLTQLIDSLSQLHLARPDDIIIQLASCSFDVHAYECMSSFILGSTLVLLRPQGNIDTHYLCETIAKSQATTIFFVPTAISILCEYFNCNVEFDCPNPLATLKCVSTGGKT